MAESTSSKMDDNSSSISSKTTDISCLKPKSFRIPSHSESVLDVLNKQRQNGEYCDVSLLVDHQRFTAHKCVLAANSPYFHSLLSNENDGMYLKQVGVDGFSVLLDFMYTSRLRLDPGNIQSVLSAAKVLQVNAAISICCRYLENQLKALTKDLNGNISKKPPEESRASELYNPTPVASPTSQHRQSYAPSYAGDGLPPPAPQPNRQFFTKRPEKYNGGSVSNRPDMYNGQNGQHHQHHPKYRSDNETIRMDTRQYHNHPQRKAIAHSHYPAPKQKFYSNQNPSYPPTTVRNLDPKTDKRYAPQNNQGMRQKEPPHMRRDPNEHRQSWTRDYQPNYASTSASPPPKGELWDRRREENLLLTRHCSREYEPEYKNVSKTLAQLPKSADARDRKREENLLLSRHSDRHVVRISRSSETPVCFSEINSYERAMAKPRTLLITRPNCTRGRATVASQKY